MTRHAEMERPDEVQEAEFARIATVPFLDFLENRLSRATKPGLRHARPYSRLCERNVFDPTYRPRHMSHRAEGAAS